MLGSTDGLFLPVKSVKFDVLTATVDSLLAFAQLCLQAQPCVEELIHEIQ